MRIIKGRFKGRRLNISKKLPVRPTTDFAKEGLFNILENYIPIEHSSFLDLCCGTGSISLEAISRGAKYVRSIDKNIYCIRHLKALCETLNIKELDAYRNSFESYLLKYNEPFDLIFADPPYVLDSVVDIPMLVFEKKLLNPNGLLIVEHSKHISFNKAPHFFMARTFGNVNFSFFKHTV